MKARCDTHIEITPSSGLIPHTEVHSNRMVETPMCTAKGKSMDEITIVDPISTGQAAEIIGVQISRVQQLCREFEQTNGASGLKSKKFGRDWLIEREAAEAYERTNRGRKPEGS